MAGVKAVPPVGVYPAEVRDADINRLGLRARELRLASGLTQQHVADFLGMSRVAISQFEHGVHDLGASRLVGLALLFGVAPGEFFENAG